jgi:acetylornithine deacetylase/succinyl-diaminopimelate desuccinylase-like protein
VALLGCGRLPPSVGQAVYERWMAALRGACGEIGAAFRVIHYKQPFRTLDSSPLVQACRGELSRYGLDAGLHSLSSTNEANVFSRFGIECAAIGPGQGVGNSHAPNERVRIGQLHDATRFYKGVIERICL